MIRRLYWPCVVVLTLLSVLVLMSATSFSWLSADRSLWIQLTSWRLSVWSGEVATSYQGTPYNQDTSRGALHISPVGIQWKLTPTAPNWKAEMFDDVSFMPDGRSNRDVIVPGTGGTVRAAQSSHLVNLKYLEFPLLYPLLAWAVVSFLPIRAYVIHRRRTARGACLRCGYDLSGIDASEPCPECGTTRIREQSATAQN